MRSKSGLVIEKLLLLSTVVSVTATILILGFLLIMAVPLISDGQFFNLFVKPWAPHDGSYGILPMVVGTLLIAGLALLWAFPISLGTASLVTVIAPGRAGGLVKKIVQLMTGIPTVVYGFVGIFLLVPIVRDLFASGSGMSVLSASLLLSILISPTMILFFINSFESVPREYTGAVKALGATKAQTLMYLVIPQSWRGVLSGVVLATGRALGDTMIALMVAGNAARIPDSPLDSARTLTSHIALIIAADYESIEFKSIFACGLVLYFFTTVAVIVMRRLGRKKSEL